MYIAPSQWVFDPSLSIPESDPAGVYSLHRNTDYKLLLDFQCHNLVVEGHEFGTGISVILRDSDSLMCLSDYSKQSYIFITAGDQYLCVFKPFDSVGLIKPRVYFDLRAKLPVLIGSVASCLSSAAIDSRLASPSSIHPSVQLQAPEYARHGIRK